MIVVMLIKDQFFSFFFPLDHALNLDLRSGTALTKSHLSLSVEIQVQNHANAVSIQQ